jgi:hypothetical protein
LLAAVALLLQIATPILHPAGPFPLGSDAGVFADAFDEHALCLSGDRSTPNNTTDQTPKPVNHNLALCCFWHGNAALAPAPDIKLELVAFARRHSTFTPETRTATRRLTGAVGARAPPIQA